MYTSMKKIYACIYLRKNLYVYKYLWKKSMHVYIYEKTINVYIYEKYLRISKFFKDKK